MPREILLNHLIGKIVRDVDGRKVGRIEELLATIEAHEHGNDYVASEFHVGAYGMLEAFTGGVFARRFLQRLPLPSTYRLFRISWDRMDLTDPERPRINCRRAELKPAETDGAGHSR
jgi:hypothetical protein